jgi:hypothetical protein
MILNKIKKKKAVGNDDNEGESDKATETDDEQAAASKNGDRKEEREVVGVVDDSFDNVDTVETDDTESTVEDKDSLPPLRKTVRTGKIKPGKNLMKPLKLMMNNQLPRMKRLKMRVKKRC